MITGHLNCRPLSVFNRLRNRLHRFRIDSGAWFLSGLARLGRLAGGC